MAPPTSTYSPQAQLPPQPQHPQQLHQSQHPQQLYTHPQPWDQTNAIPTPPMMGTWMMEGLQYGVEPLDNAWLTTQDWGQQNWVLDHFQSAAGT